MLTESYKKRISELAGIKQPGEINDNFKRWFKNSKVVKDGQPLIVHHGTGSKFKKINFKKALQPIFWFTSNKGRVEAGEVGASGKGHVLDLYISIQNPAGWPEYEKYGLGQLRDLGYDGAILMDADGSFDGFVFESNQVKSVMNDGSWDESDKNIYS